MLTSLAGVAVYGLLARLLSPQEFGVYFLILSLVSVAALMAQLGLNKAVVRLVAEFLANEKEGEAFKTIKVVLSLGVCGAALVAGFLMLGGGGWVSINIMHSPMMAQAMGWASLWVFLMALLGLVVETFRGFHDVRSATFFSNFLTNMIVVGIFSVIWFLQKNPDLYEILGISVFGTAITFVMALFFLWRKVWTFKRDADIRVAEIIHIAWPLLVTGVISFGLSQADVWVLGAFRSKEEVALYGAAVRLAGFVAVTLLVANALVPPVIASLYSQGRLRDLEKILRTAATLSSVPALLLMLVFCFLGAQVLGGVYGEFYRAGFPVLVLIGLGQLINVMTGSCGFTLMMTGHHLIAMWVTILMGLVGVAGALWVVKDHGIIGVALTFSMAMICRNFLLLYFAKKKSGIWTHIRFTGPFLSFPSK